MSWFGRNPVFYAILTLLMGVVLMLMNATAIYIRSKTERRLK